MELWDRVHCDSWFRCFGARSQDRAAADKLADLGSKLERAAELKYIVADPRTVAGWSCSNRERGAVDDTWDTRDLPVLTAAVDEFDRMDDDEILVGADIAEATGLSVQDVGRSLKALDGEYLVLCKEDVDPSAWEIERVTGNARRAVGQWPPPDNLISRLAEVLEQVAAETDEPEAKGRLRQAAAGLGGLTRSVVSEVLAKVVERQIGLS
ncbi:hypothetical protein ACFXPA_25835 [Amycolatopsis sp. NPDC059090]|uniref:hypothetical protein n=1 Tax=unclassified Amycolatopsis TaxID=2618356 RepID=UPI00366EAA51